MAEITLYSAQGCSYCLGAEQLLKQKSVVQVNKILVDTEPAQLAQMIAKTGRRTVPQIFIGEVHVGGFDDLVALDNAGKLDRLLAE